jgi:death-on-curing protein
MTEPKWLTVAEVVGIHEEQLALFGGPPGIRDAGLLESALARPKNRSAYEQGEMPDLAAAYAFGIARNHPFVDGNKRAAFASLMVFLRYNDVPLAPPPAEATAIILDLAAGSVDEADLVRWIRANWPAEPRAQQ